ncbi:MAG TPA: hypothetical protein VKS98_02535 [Chthoniobacterales bacterium]|nr:hypothetical protein [Chthoniobacterales bacterium]
MNSVGAIIVASFAIVWVAAGASQLKRQWFLTLLGLGVLISGSIVFAAAKIPFGRQSEGFNGKIYAIFVTLEVVAIVIAVTLLKRIGAKQYLIPAIAFIVGAHFFGMVPALGSNEFWWVGGAMCLLPLVTISILPQEKWSPTVGIGCAMILWLSAVGAFF